MLTEDVVRRLTPNISPRLESLSPDIRASLGEAGDDPGGRRLSWTQFLLQGEFADNVLRIANATEQAWHAGVGLVPCEGVEIEAIDAPSEMTSAIKDSGYVWGGVVYTSKAIKPYMADAYRRLHFAENRFPIIVRQAGHIPQVLLVKDAGSLRGTATCWALGRPKSTAIAFLKGSLTAGHVLGSGTGSLTVEDSGTSYTVSSATYAPPCIDVAFLDTGWPASAPSIFTPQPATSISAGDKSDFSGAVTTGVSGFVTHISAYLKYTGSGVPMLLCHDGLGSGGDSGSLVNIKGMPTALHLSQITLDAGGLESRTILLQQVQHVMDIDLYQ